MIATKTYWLNQNKFIDLGRPAPPVNRLVATGLLFEKRHH